MFIKTIGDLQTAIKEREASTDLSAEEIAEELENLPDLFWRDGSVEEYEQLFNAYLEFVNKVDILRQDKRVEVAIESIKNDLKNRKEFCQFICRAIDLQASKVFLRMQSSIVLKEFLQKENNYVLASQDIDKERSLIYSSNIEKLNFSDFDRFVGKVFDLLDAIILAVQNLGKENSAVQNIRPLTFDNKIEKHEVFLLKYYRSYSGYALEYGMTYGKQYSRHPLDEELLKVIKNLNKSLDHIDKSQNKNVSNNSANTSLVAYTPEMVSSDSKQRSLLAFFLPRSKESAIVNNRRIFLDSDAKSIDKASACLKLALHYLNVAQNVVIHSDHSANNNQSSTAVISSKNYYPEFEMRNAYIQAGIYLEIYFSYQKEAKKVENFDDVQLKEIDARGTHWQVEFHNNDTNLYVLPSIIEILKNQFTKQQLLAMRNTTIDLSFLSAYLDDKNNHLNESEYINLALRYPKYVSEFIFLKLIYNNSLSSRFCLNQLPTVAEKLMGRIRANLHGVGGTRDSREWNAKLLALVSEQVSSTYNAMYEKIIDAKILEEIDWISWSTYNRNKINICFEQNIPQLVEKFIEKYGKNPLAIFEFSVGEVSNLTTDLVKKKYYNLAKKYHPDSQGGGADQAKFVQLNEAYVLLSDQNCLDFVKQMQCNSSNNNNNETDQLGEHKRLENYRESIVSIINKYTLNSTLTALYLNEKNIEQWIHSYKQIFALLYYVNVVWHKEFQLPLEFIKEINEVSLDYIKKSDIKETSENLTAYFGHFLKKRQSFNMTEITLELDELLKAIQNVVNNLHTSEQSTNDFEQKGTPHYSALQL